MPMVEPPLGILVTTGAPEVIGNRVTSAPNGVVRHSSRRCSAQVAWWRSCPWRM